jgi:hypothetical protein
LRRFSCCKLIADNWSLAPKAGAGQSGAPFFTRGTASTALAKSATTLSPAVLKIRPRCDAIRLSMIARKAFSRASVATSSRPITGYSQLCRSPAKIAASCAVPSGRAGLTAPHPSIASRTGPFRLALLPPGRTVPLPVLMPRWVVSRPPRTAMPASGYPTAPLCVTPSRLGCPRSDPGSLPRN